MKLFQITTVALALQGIVCAATEAYQPCVAPPSSSEISLSPLSICKALDKALEFFNISPEQIVPVNEEQRAFLNSDYQAYRQHLTKGIFGPHELHAYTARDAETLNKILRDNGFSIQLQEFASSDSVGVVAIQDILVKWLEEAEQKSIRSAGKEYPGFALDADEMHVSFYGDDQSNPHIVIAEIATQSDDKVYCAARIKAGSVVPFFEGNNLSDHDIMHAINSLRLQLKDPNKYRSTHLYNTMELPMIDYQKRPSIEWLLGLMISGSFVGQALQEVIFKMNEIGARAKAAVSIEILRSAPPSLIVKPLIINQPFLLWIERPGMPLPIFAEYLQQEYWSNPVSLEN